MDFLRPFMFPIVVCTIVGTVWAMAYNKQIEDRTAQAAQPASMEEILREAAKEPPVEPIAGLDGN